jgi:hypothetical protein
MSDVVGRVNWNNEQVKSLWAYADIVVDIDDNGHNTHAGLSGVLLFRRPTDLLLRGKDAILGPVFEVGSNSETYWLKIVPQVDTAWYGSYANIGKTSTKGLPIPPDLLVEVLGVSLFNTNFLQQPVPVMRFDSDMDVYEFTWTVRLQDHWAAQKTVRYDRATLNPVYVSLYDENGRPLVWANLKYPVPVEVAGTPRDKWPRVASSYDLHFPDSHTELKLSLSNVALKHGAVPSDASFRMPSDDTWGVKNVIQVDASNSQ